MIPVENKLDFVNHLQLLVGQNARFVEIGCVFAHGHAMIIIAGLLPGEKWRDL